MRLHAHTSSSICFWRSNCTDPTNCSDPTILPMPHPYLPEARLRTRCSFGIVGKGCLTGLSLRELLSQEVARCLCVLESSVNFREVCWVETQGDHGDAHMLPHAAPTYSNMLLPHAPTCSNVLLQHARVSRTCRTAPLKY